jgi:Ca2+-transporting ATPase
MPIDFEAFAGLTDQQVQNNRRQFGGNKLYEKERKSIFSYFKRIIEEPMLLLLLAAAILYFIIGSNWDGLLMLAGVMFIVGIDFYQARKTDKALETLKELSTPKIKVIRNGKMLTIVGDDLVRGDYLIVREGDRIAGDGIIKSDSNFTVDESALTGESGSIHKTKAMDIKNKEQNKVLAGTLALSGQAVIEVTAVGINTQYGKIGESLSTIEDKITPLQKQTKQIIKIFAIVGALACFSLMAIIYYTNRDAVDSLLKGLTLAISVIPEEIPVVLTVFAALGAYRLTKKQTLVRKINAIETLGHITTLCTDKTGTLTENRMELQEIYSNNKNIITKSADKSNIDLMETINISLLASQPNPFDSMDISIHELAKKIGLNPETTFNKIKLTQEYGFDQKLKFMGQLWQNEKEKFLAIKGSAEHVVKICNLPNEQKRKLLKEINSMAVKGLRVLAVAKKTINGKRNPLTLNKVNDFEFTALLGFKDPPRADAKTAVRIARKAGIKVRMITGDHPQTALQIARAVGLTTNGEFIIGTDLDKMSEKELMGKVEKITVFARINPEQKLKIISALQKNGEVVAMIGDGVNDAPCLKDANIGIAMGERGTNVAREAADIILLDDRLITVVNAISDGRRIFDNIQKAVGYIFIVHAYIILTALLIPIAGLPILLTPIHIVLLELIIDPTCALVFEAIPAEKDIMKRKPRNPLKALVPNRQLFRILLIGVMIFGVTLTVYITVLRQGFTNEQARTIAFSLIVWTNLLLVLTAGSKKQLFGNITSFFHNKAFIYVYSIVIFGLLILIYTPFINVKFGFAVIPVWILMGTALLGFLPLLFGELLKKIFSYQIKKPALGR